MKKRLYIEEMKYQFQKALEGIDQKFQQSLDTEQQIQTQNDRVMLNAWKLKGSYTLTN